MTEDAAKPPLRPVERPLMLGEVFAETIRVYGERIWFAFGLGVSVAAAIALAAVDDRAAGRVYNVGETESLTELEWAERIASAAGWSGRFVTLPAERMPRPLLIPGNTDQHWTIDTTRIREELGYREPVAQADAIRRTIEWERANPTALSPYPFDYDAEDAALKKSL